MVKYGETFYDRHSVRYILIDKVHYGHQVKALLTFLFQPCSDFYRHLSIGHRWTYFMLQDCNEPKQVLLCLRILTFNHFKRSLLLYLDEI